MTRPAVLPALFFALLTGCSSAPTRIFALDPVPSRSAPRSYEGPPLRVDTVHVPPAWDRSEILEEVAPGELKIRDLDLWSAPLHQAAQQALSADLVTRLPPGRVTFPHLAKPDGGLGVSVDILSFHTDRTGASLEAGWSIDPNGPSSSTATLRVAEPDAGGDPAATARAFSRLLAQLADHIVANLPPGR